MHISRERATDDDDARASDSAPASQIRAQQPGGGHPGGGGGARAFARRHPGAEEGVQKGSISKRQHRRILGADTRRRGGRAQQRRGTADKHA
jgi:hypothetical protein